MTIKKDSNPNTINQKELKITKKPNTKKISLTVKEEKIIDETEKLGEEIHKIEELTSKISQNIRDLFEYYSETDNAPEETKNAA